MITDVSLHPKYIECLTTSNVKMAQRDDTTQICSRNNVIKKVSTIPHADEVITVK